MFCLLESVGHIPLNNVLFLSFVFPLGWTDTPGGCPAGCRRRRPLCWRQHTRRRTQDPGPRARQGTAEDEQARYPGHLRRSHPPTGSRLTRFNYFSLTCPGLVFLFSLISTELNVPFAYGQREGNSYSWA